MTNKSKRIKLISLIALLVAVIAIFFVVDKINKEKEQKEATKSEETTNITIGSTQAEKVVSFSYIYEGTEYVFNKENEVWYCVNDTGIELDQDTINNMVENFSNVTANRIVEEEASDLTQYGLDNPTNKITVTDSEAVTIIYEIGNENGTVNGYYIKKDNENTVYLTDTFPTLFAKTLDDLKKVEDDSSTTDTTEQE